MDYPNDFNVRSFPAGKTIAFSRIVSIWILIVFFLIITMCSVLLLGVYFKKNYPFLISVDPFTEEWNTMFLPALSVVELKKRLLAEYPSVPDLDKIAEISVGVPGVAKKIIENDGLSLYDSFLNLMLPVDSVSVEEVLDFADEVTKGVSQMDLVCLFMLQFVANQAKNSPVVKGNDWSQFYVYLQNEWRKMDRLYLDKAQTIAEMIFSIERRLG